MRLLLAALLALVAVQAGARESLVRFPNAAAATGVSQAEITGLLAEPAGEGRHPAIVLLHGCGGLYAKNGQLTARHRDWLERLVGAGFVVLMPDSFGSRGFGSICTGRPQDFTVEGDRVSDALAALAFLRSRPDVNSGHIDLMGWSNGGSTVLETVAQATAGGFHQAIAFYPGCLATLRRHPGYKPVPPLTVLHGEADDWTPLGPCRALQAIAGFPLATYPGAYHEFDNPGGSVRLLPQIRNGVHAGRDEAARQDAIARVMALVR